MNTVKGSTSGRHLREQKRGRLVGVAQKTWLITFAAYALGVLHTDPSAWGQTLALTP